MKTFRINNDLEIVCESKKTRNGFKHEATLLINGVERETAKCCYLNRTWEAYEYQSVIMKLVDKARWLNDQERIIIKNYMDGTDGYDGEGNNQAMRPLRTVAMVAKMGEVFGRTSKEKNDWKARMLKAGLGTMGLTMPEDWESLDEETKQARLDAVINQLQTK